VRARLVGAVRPDAVVVPQRAVQQGAKGHFAWVINKQNEAELRPIVVGDWHGGDGWIVSEGLQAGDQIVVDGGIRLTPGAAVIAKPYVAPKAEPAGGAIANARPIAPPAASAVPSRALPPTAAVYFARDSAALDADAANAVRQASAATMGIGTAITVTGYADRTGSREANVGLAKRRAIAVRNALVANGIPPERIRLTPPVDVTGAGSDDRARRVDVGLAP
jgi:membrane fusion protein (multidrug efflux system)